MPALLGSLVLVAMIRKGETPVASPAYIIGANVSDALQGGFIALSGALGALGSFFSGSTTVSNLTFGRVQSVRSSPAGWRPLCAPRCWQCGTRARRPAQVAAPTCRTSCEC